MNKTEQIREMFNDMLNNIKPVEDVSVLDSEELFKKAELTAHIAILVSLEELFFECMLAVEEAGNE